MEFESENHALKSAEGSSLALSCNSLIGGDVKVECNGFCAHVDEHDSNTNGIGCREPAIDSEGRKEEDEKLNLYNHENVELSPGHSSLHSNCTASGDFVDAFTVVSLSRKVNENDQSVAGSPVSPAEVPLGSPVTSPPSSGSRGRGLRKWRRIRREFVSDGSPITNFEKVLKRGSEDVSNPTELAVENKQRSENQESFIVAMLRSPVDVDAFSAVRSRSGIDSKLAVGSTFNPGVVSDDESKLCTAASFPKSRHDLVRAPDHPRDKHRTKHISGRHSGNTFPRLQQNTDQVDDSLKERVEAFTMNRGNSLSSLEFDSINLSPVFMQDSFSAVNNGQSDSHVVGQSDDEPAMGKPVEGVVVDSGKIIEDEDILQGNAAILWKFEGRDENLQSPGNQDPLAGCVEVLKFAQDALEQELLKFTELGKDLSPLDDDLVGNHDLAEASGCSSLELPAFKYSTGSRENSATLEKQLGQARVMLKQQVSKIAELEATINNIKTSNGDLGTAINIYQKNLKEIEEEYETLFRQKMETEIQHLVIADTKTTAETQLKHLLVQQKSLVTTQAQGTQRVGQSSGKAASLRDETEEAITSSRGGGREEYNEKLRKRIAKLTFCFFIQVMMYMLVVVLFVSENLPETEVVLPT